MTTAPHRPFTVSEYRNPKSKTTSWRVSGTGDKLGRIRKNFSNHAEAVGFCNQKNLEDAAGARTTTRLAQTWLSDAHLRVCEAVITQIGEDRNLQTVVDAGLEALKRVRPEQPIAPLLETWLKLVKEQVSGRWYTDLKTRNELFLDRNPGLTTNTWTRAVTVKWLDDQDLSKNSKANYRNAIHRFGRWLVDRGHMEENPAAEIWLSSSKSADAKAALPTILLPAQVRALGNAFMTAECRRMVGWYGSCLFAGLRPESEAPRQLWTELNWKTGEYYVIGRKRGVKNRIIKLHPTALAWLKVAHDDKCPTPGRHLTKVRRRAVEIANDELRASGGPLIVWDEDILRHTFASYRSGMGVPAQQLADEMGTSVKMIIGHYRHPRPEAEVKAFWEILPKAA